METTSIDRLTVIAIAVVVYAGANVTHEIIGHCGTALLLGGKCIYISTTDIRLSPNFPTWKFRLDAFAGSGANWLAGLMYLWFLRKLETASPAMRFFLWLSAFVNLFLASSYLLASPVIRFGDWYSITLGLRGELPLRIAMTGLGACACWLFFRLSSSELGDLTGPGREFTRSDTWALILPAYISGGIITVAAALFSPLPARWALFIAAGGTFGTTIWLLLLPMRVKSMPASKKDRFTLPRSVGWLMAGVLAATLFVGLLGRGFPI